MRRRSQYRTLGPGALRQNPESRRVKTWKSAATATRSAAVKALTKLHAPAAAVTRDGLWTKLYVRGFSPKKAAELAEREYRSARPPDWIKRRR
jgi:hypothetical protein